MGKYVIAGLVIVVMAAAAYAVVKPKPEAVSTNQTIEATVSTEPTAEPTAAVSPTPVSSPKSGGQQTVQTQSGPPRGQITCDYQVPAGPNTYGTTALEANWNNLITNKSGAAEAAVCVRVNGQAPSLMSIINKANGSTVVYAPWIALTANYSFELYDDHGGDVPKCGGDVLATCRVDTSNLPKTLPSPGARR